MNGFSERQHEAILAVFGAARNRLRAIAQLDGGDVRSRWSWRRRQAHRARREAGLRSDDDRCRSLAITYIASGLRSPSPRRWPTVKRCWPSCSPSTAPSSSTIWPGVAAQALALAVVASLPTPARKQRSWESGLSATCSCARRARAPVTCALSVARRAGTRRARASPGSGGRACRSGPCAARRRRVSSGPCASLVIRA